MDVMDLEMELPEKTLKRFDALMRGETLSDENFDKLLEIVGLSIVGKKFDKINYESVCNVDNNEGNAMKIAYHDLASLFVEAARQKWNGENMRFYLSSSKRSNQLARLYGQINENIICTLSSIGDCLPYIVNVDIRTDFCVMQSTDDERDECMFHVRVTLMKHHNVPPTYLRFSCTTLQLQQLLYKLRDAIRHMEKLAV